MDEKHPLLVAIILRLEKYGFNNEECNDEGEDFGTDEIQLESSVSDDKFYFTVDEMNLEVYGPCGNCCGTYEIGDPNNFDFDKIEKDILTEQVNTYKVDRKTIENRRIYFEGILDGLQRMLEKIQGENDAKNKEPA
jgi:hypothetical protein